MKKQQIRQKTNVEEAEKQKIKVKTKYGRKEN